MDIRKIFLVEFHDIDNFDELMYNINIGVPRFWRGVMVISFIGHRSLQNGERLLKMIEKTILENTNGNEHIVFLCGGYGDFDDLSAHVCRSIKSKRQNCELVFVTPYITVAQQEKMKQLVSMGLYDSTVYPPLENVPHKFAIAKRNEWMIDQSDLIIACVAHSFGGAYQGLRYARRKEKHIINLA